VFLKRWTAGRHSPLNHGNSRWRGRRMAGTGDASSTVAAQVVAGCGPNVRLGASGSRRAATDRRRDQHDRCRTVQLIGALGRCHLGYLEPSDDPSRSLTIRFHAGRGSWDLTWKRSLGPPQRFRRVTGRLSETERFCGNRRSPTEERPAGVQNPVSENRRRTTASAPGFCDSSPVVMSRPPSLSIRSASVECVVDHFSIGASEATCAPAPFK
jgi:hypothetical protein